MNRWIDANFDKPSDEEYVAVLVKKDKKPKIGFFCDERWIVTSWGENMPAEEFHDCNDITHWMHLPKEPEKEIKKTKVNVKENEKYVVRDDRFSKKMLDHLKLKKAEDLLFDYCTLIHEILECDDYIQARLVLIGICQSEISLNWFKKNGNIQDLSKND